MNDERRQVSIKKRQISIKENINTKIIQKINVN